MTEKRVIVQMLEVKMNEGMVLPGLFCANLDTPHIWAASAAVPEETLEPQLPWVHPGSLETWNLLEIQLPCHPPCQHYSQEQSRVLDQTQLTDM